MCRGWFFSLGRSERVRAFWFKLTDDMLDLEHAHDADSGGAVKEQARASRLPHGREVALLREQLMARAPGTRCVFPTADGGKWDRSRFGDRAWVKSVAAARPSRARESGQASTVYDGFPFHLLRHTAGSLMAAAGLDPAVAWERLGHTDGGALFLRTYRHLYEGEKRIQAERLEAHVRASMDKEGTTAPGSPREWLNEADSGRRLIDRDYWRRL